MEIQNEIIHAVEDFIDKYRHLTDVKFYFILGKYSIYFGFEKHIFQKEMYSNIEKLLHSCCTWESINEDNRLSKNKEIDKLIILCKNGPFDLLVTVNSPMDEDGIKTGISFRKNYHNFNLGVITTKLDQMYYTFNITSDIPPNYSSVYISHSSLLKVCDILGHLSNVTELQFVIVNTNL